MIADYKNDQHRTCGDGIDDGYSGFLGFFCRFFNHTDADRSAERWRPGTEMSEIRLDVA